MFLFFLFLSKTQFSRILLLLSNSQLPVYPIINMSPYFNKIMALKPTLIPFVFLFILCGADDKLSTKDCENLGFTGLALCSDCHTFAEYIKDQGHFHLLFFIFSCLHVFSPVFTVYSLDNQFHLDELMGDLLHIHVTCPFCPKDLIFFSFLFNFLRFSI